MRRLLTATLATTAMLLTTGVAGAQTNAPVYPPPAPVGSAPVGSAPVYAAPVQTAPAPIGTATYPAARTPYGQPYPAHTAQAPNYNTYNAPYGQPQTYGAPAPPAAETPDASSGSDGTGLLVGGVVTLGSFYLASVLSGAGLGAACDAAAPAELDMTDIPFSLCGDADTDLSYVPVVGPFIAVAELEGTEMSVWPLNVALVGVGLGQVTGLVLLLAGALTDGEPEPTPVTVTPMVGTEGAAMSVRVAF